MARPFRASTRLDTPSQRDSTVSTARIPLPFHCVGELAGEATPADFWPTCTLSCGASQASKPVSGSRIFPPASLPNMSSTSNNDCWNLDTMMDDYIFCNKDPNSSGSGQQATGEPTNNNKRNSVMDLPSFYGGSDKETAAADSRSIHTNDPPGEDAESVVEIQRRNLRGMVVDGTIDKELSSPRSYGRRRGCYCCYCPSVPRCFRGWSSREKVLLSLLLFNTLVILGLLGSNIMVLQSKTVGEESALSTIENQSPSSNASTPIIRHGNTWDCPGVPGVGNTGGDSSNSDGGENISPPSPSSGSFGGATNNETPVGDPDSLCGCAACTEQIWNSMAGEASCGDRINYLTRESPRLYPTQVHACRRIAFEYPCACGGCDPSRCQLPTPEFILPENYAPPKGATPAPTPIPKVTEESFDLEQLDLYCFPDPSQRATYRLWGGMVLQVKEDASKVCGPGNNRFARDTVIVDEVEETVTLQYKNGVASEVRILLPEEQRPFTYGTYSFSVRSVVVKDAVGDVISNVLPKDLVLGLFTWDSMEDYAVRENYNHEVDIEVSRWGCETNSDLQFLVQPPGQPQMHRLFSGTDPTSPDNKYSQAGHVHSFTWNPAQIDWATSAGGIENNRFSLKTEEAVYRNVPDYVQCLPDVGGSMEVRLNLWNYVGAVQPGGTSVIEVVIDRFSFTPSDVMFAPVGSICTKHCQCEGKCIDHRCS